MGLTQIDVSLLMLKSINILLIVLYKICFFSFSLTLHGVELATLQQKGLAIYCNTTSMELWLWQSYKKQMLVLEEKALWES